jgi:hypothetical protein
MTLAEQIDELINSTSKDMDLEDVRVAAARMAAAYAMGGLKILAVAMDDLTVRIDELEQTREAGELGDLVEDVADLQTQVAKIRKVLKRLSKFRL